MMPPGGFGPIPPTPVPQWLSDLWEKQRKAAARAKAAAARRANQAQRQASRSPGGWQYGGYVGPNQTVEDMMHPIGLNATFQAPIRANPSMLSAGMARRANQAQRLGSRGPGGWQAGGPVKGFARGDLATVEEPMPLWGAEHRLDTRLGQGLPQSVFSTAYNRAAQVRSRDDPDFKASILGRLGTLPLDILTQLAEIMLSPAQSASGLSAGRQARETGEYLSQEDVNAIFNPNSREALIAERDRLQQQLQTADEAMAQEIMAQIMEINKELEMAAAPGMAGGGILSLRGGGRTVNPRAWARRPIQQALQVPMGPPARLSRPGWGSPGLDIPGGG